MNEERVNIYERWIWMRRGVDIEDIEDMPEGGICVEKDGGREREEVKGKYGGMGDEQMEEGKEAD